MKEVTKHYLWNSLLLYLFLTQGFSPIKLLPEMASWSIRISQTCKARKNKKMSFWRCCHVLRNCVLMVSIWVRWRKSIINWKSFRLGPECSLRRMEVSKRMSGERRFTIWVSKLSVRGPWPWAKSRVMAVMITVTDYITSLIITSWGANRFILWYYQFLFCFSKRVMQTKPS